MPGEKAVRRLWGRKRTARMAKTGREREQSESGFKEKVRVSSRWITGGRSLPGASQARWLADVGSHNAGSPGFEALLCDASELP